VTTLACIPAAARAGALLLAKQDGLLAGLEVARLAFELIDDTVEFEAIVADGDTLTPGLAVARIAGSARSLLTAERVALNFVQRLSGIATLTRRYADRLEGTGTRVLDTRKTTPGLRPLEKYAVSVGGGHNHRHGLYDMYLVKDNHIRAAGSLSAAVERIAAVRDPDLLLEVEAASLELVEEAMGLDVDRILLDNMTLGEVAEAVARIDASGAPARTSPRRPVGARRWPEIEVSGGMNLGTVRPVADLGVDYVSVGALTHSAPALDLALDFGELG
jgi:nicotinate-nucleotide pyrophosphorylase (carboxylating)